MKRIYVVGTADTKGPELAFLRETLQTSGANTTLVDVGTRTGALINADIAQDIVAGFAPEGAASILRVENRGAAVAAMAEAFARFIATRSDIAGIIGIGGGGGTSIITAGMRRLPIGLPKVMVSTLASGDVAPYLGVSDIIMVPSITDMAGLNRISRVVLNNAAQAIAGMCARPAQIESDQKAIGLTMFGVTTPCVTEIVRLLGATCEPIVFHATGTGGKSMEALVSSGLLSGLLDITTTEVCDLLVGGVLPAGPERLDVVANTRVPYVGSVGALDMVNFWAPGTIPARFAGRRFHNHNANVTLMRTTASECREIGRWIARKLNRCEGPVRFLIPERGVSALDIEGGTFFDPEADSALFEAIETGARWTGNRQLLRLPLHINDPAFAAAAVATFSEISPSP